MQNIEVEIRSFITKEEYTRLLEYFKQKAKLVKEDFQETHYFDCPQDLRIQKNNSGSKIWLKKGQIHDDFREEIEIISSKENFPELEKLFTGLGHNVEIKWLRDRKQFDWDGIKVCLDYTKGYGHIIELEKLTSENLKGETLTMLNEKFEELHIKGTPKEIFNEKFNNYKQNWRNLINE